MKLSAIASALDLRLENGSPETEIHGLNGIEQAGPGELTFVSNPKYAAAARTTKAAAVIVAEDFPSIPAPVLRAKNPYLSFARALELFHPPQAYAPGIHPSAVVDASAKIGANAHIGPYVVIDEDVEIGANAVLLAHVVIYRGVRIGDNFFAHAHAVVRENCRLGDNVVLQNGVVIGGDGRVARPLFSRVRPRSGCPILRGSLRRMGTMRHEVPTLTLRNLVIQAASYPPLQKAQGRGSLSHAVQM